ncbi:hypothetical protein X943_001996 [Babesia divergens]|uniref:Rab-GAP TBC domain-containing protein n=1 Tax=Babesia divergens TaxID=32595 RepID=A0AAD9G744_BABDI|nr:hypothetical protein X943_001996 [Babesia divergens]
MMINQQFWDAERKSCLLNRSGVRSHDELAALFPKVQALITGDATADDVAGSVMQYITDLISTCSIWATSEPTDGTTASVAPKFEVTPENERIFRLDAERTFISEEYRQVLCHNLKVVYEHIGDYHQGEGFVIAFLSMFLKSSDVVDLVVQLHTNQMRGYFSCMPEAYVRDCRVLMKLLEERNERLHSHIEGLLVPETFCSKWFIAMNIHVFTFEHVITYMQRVLTRGQTYIFSFGLAFLLYHADEIVACNDVSKILQLLRLDEAIMPEESQRDDIYNGILNLADETEVDEENISQLRKDVEEELQQQKEAREKRLKELDYSDDEIKFSDEE